MLDTLEPADRPRCYDDLKALSKALRRPIKDLLAMACQNDPFYTLPAQVKQAEWFAALWERFDFQAGVHLRRIHYKLISQADPVPMADGRPYQNSERCWQYLGGASKAARALRLVDPEAFDDKRNPDPVLNRAYGGDRPQPRWRSDFDRCGFDWRLPAINADLASELDWSVPGVRVDGYWPTDRDQPFHLELISEKSTMDDVIVLLCKELGVNYAPFTGFASITGAVSMLKRLRQADKPGVAFYVSDFDPGGTFMPPAVARQLEYWRPVYAPDQDLVLMPVVLTREQVIEYQLPPIPIKETDKRASNFLLRHDAQGATELDALEALHPGELEKILRQAISPYWDSRAAWKARDAHYAADTQIANRWRKLSRPYRWRMARIKEWAEEILGNYSVSVKELADALEDDLSPIKSALDDLRQAVKTELDEFDPDLPDRYQSELTLPERFDGLFDSRRGYLEQIRHYKAGPDAADLEEGVE